MKKFFLIPLLTLVCSVMAFANVAQITFSDEREAVDCADLAALQTAIAALPTDGTVATIQLLDDINGGTLSGSNVLLNFLSNQKVVLDLNTKNISANITSKTAYIIKNNGADLTINDLAGGEKGVIENTNNATNHWSYPTIYSDNSNSSFNFVRGKIIAGSGLVLKAENTEVTIEDGMEMYANMPYGIGSGKSNSPIIFGLGATTITVNGGHMKSVGSYCIYVNEKENGQPAVTIYGGIFEANEFTGVLSGDNTYSYDIQGGSYNSDPSQYVNQNAYAVLLSNGMYEVRALGEALEQTVYNLNELKYALNAATASNPITITLGANIVVNEEVELQHGSQLIIPSGKTLSVVTNGLFVNEGTTTNNGTIICEGTGYFSRPAKVQGSGSFSGYQSALVGETYYVSTAMQLQFLSVLDTKSFSTIELTTDINLPNVYFDPINDLYADIEGNGHIINNLRISETGDAGLSIWQHSSARNLTINADVQTATGYVGILSRCIDLETGDASAVIEKVVVNGIVHRTGNGYGTAGLIGQIYIDPSVHNNHIWFVNCTNNANVSASGSANVGGFVGTATCCVGSVGFYNCVNNGNITANSNITGFIGHGSGTGDYGGYPRTKFEFINAKNTGTITRASGSAISTDCGIELVGAGSAASMIICTYVDPETYTAVYDESLGKYVAKEAGTLDNTNATTTDWATNTTWTEEDNVKNVVPTEADNVLVSSTVVVNDGTDAVANSVEVAENQELTVKDGASLTVGEGLEIAAGATVTVEEGATLIVGKDGITGAGELIVEATEDGGTGVVLVDPAAPAAKARPEASVELIPDAYKIAEDFYKHRYIGIPLYFEGAEEFTSANWEREAIQGGESVVSHAKIWNNGWQDVTSISEFVPFKGYALSNESTHGVKYTFKGKLVGNGDGTMNFAYGFNLFANSYTAPINIQTLLNGLSNDVKATIYMFKENKLQTVSKADFAGFRTPKFTVIPSLQAFFVLMDDGTSASESINYAEAVFNNSLDNGPLYAPKHQEAPAFNRVRINIAAENGESDEVYLIEAADYTSDFENGFDEVKYMNNGLNLFATTAYGRQSTKISNDLNGTFIGVQGNGTYTMSFDELVGEEYQIRDLQTNAIVTMSEDNTYMFTANGTDDARFVVESIAKMPTALNNVDAAKMFINNNTLYISENNTNANIMIYAANGQLVLNEVAQPTVSLNGLASGVYTVRVANQTLKFVK